MELETGQMSKQGPCLRGADGEPGVGGEKESKRKQSLHAFAAPTTSEVLLMITQRVLLMFLANDVALWYGL